MKFVGVLYLLVLFLSQNADASRSRESEVQTNVIYKSCGHYLYDQSRIVSQSKYIDADENVKAQMLKNEFEWRKAKCYAIEFTKLALTLAPTGAVIYWLTNRINFNVGAAGGLAAPLLIHTIFGGPISKVALFIQNGVENLFSMVSSIASPLLAPITQTLWGNTQETDSLGKYELDYVKKKQYLPVELQEILEENFIRARIGGSEGSQGATEKASSKSPIEFAKNVLSLPTHKKEINYSTERLKKYLGTYDPKIFAQFKRYAARHAAASTGTTVKKIVAYFQGPPGVGKSRAAENLALALEIPFFVIKLGDQTLAQIQGDEKHPGLLLEAIMKARYNGTNAKNAYIFFDELDWGLGFRENSFSGHSGRSSKGDSSLAVVQFLLTLFEPGQKTFYSRYLGAHVSIEDILFGGAGNMDWEEELKKAAVKDTALKDRFEFIRFAGYSPEFKWMVVETELFDDLLRTYKTSKKPLSRDDFSTKEWQAVKQVVLADKDPGFREVIRLLQNVLDDKALCKYYDECSNIVFNLVPPPAPQIFTGSANEKPAVDNATVCPLRAAA